MKRIATPPDGFGDSFLRWLLDANEELGGNVAKGPGLPAVDVRWLYQELGMQLPADFHAFYRHCTPWRMWREPRREWQQIRQRVAGTSGVREPLLPVDINSQVGNHYVAVVGADCSYRLWQTSGYGLFVDRGSSLREFLAAEIADEVRFARWAEGHQLGAGGSWDEPSAAPDPAGM